MISASVIWEAPHLPGGTIKVTYLPAHLSNKLNPLCAIIEQNGGISSKKPESFAKALLIFGLYNPLKHI